MLSDFHATHQKTFSFALKATAEITMLHLQAETFGEVIDLLRVQGNEENPTVLSRANAPFS
jgi:hypothetical protein